MVVLYSAFVFLFFFLAFEDPSLPFGSAEGISLIFIYHLFFVYINANQETKLENYYEIMHLSYFRSKPSFIETLLLFIALIFFRKWEVNT
jgi:hypothetical protein